MAAPITGVGQSASSEAIAARCLSLVELALSTGAKIGCHQASFGFVDEDDRSYWLIQQPVCQKHWFKECMVVSRTRQGLTGMKQLARDNKELLANSA
jgi:hypothetical protein